MVARITQRITQTLRRLDSAIARRLEPAQSASQEWSMPLNESESMRGRLSFRNASQLRKALFALLAKPRKVLCLVCDRVEFCDGAAMAALLEFAMACQERKTRLCLLDPSESLSNSFKLYGLHQMLEALSTRSGSLPTSQAVELCDETMLVIVEDEFPDSIRISPLPDAA